MSDESSAQKTEEPTPRRIDEARRKGQLPRSRELVSFSVALGGVFGLAAMAANAPAFLRQTLAGHLNFDAADVRHAEVVTQLMQSSLITTVAWMAPLLALTAAGAVAGSVAIGGWNLSAEALKPDFSRLNPIKGIGRLFSVQSLAELGKGLAKFFLLGSILCGILWSARQELYQLGLLSINEAMASGSLWLLFTLAAMSGGLLVIAAVDAPFQKYQHTKRLRMSRHEVREDMKQTEGRPEVKQRVRALQQEAANRRLQQVVPTADVVVTNPQHFAVALQYQPDSMAAPKLLAKGKGPQAALIRSLAKSHQIPLVEAPPLARSLFRFVKEGAAIPAALYLGVAQVLGYVFQLRDNPLADVAPPRPEVPEDWQWAPESD